MVEMKRERHKIITSLEVGQKDVHKKICSSYNWSKIVGNERLMMIKKNKPLQKW